VIGRRAASARNTPGEPRPGVIEKLPNVFQYTGGAWQNRVDNGANGTSPHADSRRMAFDPSGNLDFVGDGGVFQLQSADTGGRKWVSINGTITPTEAHAVAYDELNHVLVTGNQDNGTSYQMVQNMPTWNSIITGDGGNPQVDNNQAAHAGTVIRYSGFDNLKSLTEPPAAGPSHTPGVARPPRPGDYKNVILPLERPEEEFTAWPRSTASCRCSSRRPSPLWPWRPRPGPLSS
jgi:hypothetical protein